MLKRIYVILALAAVMQLAGCTSMVNLEGSELGLLKVGETVTIFEHDGSIYPLYITVIGGDFIRGKYNGGGFTVTIPKDEIEAVERETIDYSKTAAVMVSPIAFIIALYAIPY